MAAKQSTRPPRGGKAGILSRDSSGNEHLLLVTDHPFGLVSLFDDEMIRILTPNAAAALVVALIDAMGSYLPVLPGRPS